MSTSEARLIANRKNALRSTGPRTPEGKGRSRANGLKHGLAGEGLVLPEGDAAEVARRTGALEAEMRPRTELGRILVGRVAFLSVRLERSERHEMAAVAGNVRNAEADFDDRRLGAVEALAANIADEPTTSVRRLRGSPEGLARLLAGWAELRADLLGPRRDAWSPGHPARMENLLGLPRQDHRVSRVAALSLALRSDFSHLAPGDGEGLDERARSGWARLELAAMIDAEVDRLREAREAFDPSIIEADRAGAAECALFDASPEAVLARRYEAATERGLYRALREFRQAEAEADDPAPIEAGIAGASRPLGSSRPAVEAPPAPLPPPAPTRPIPAPALPPAPPMPAPARRPIAPSSDFVAMSIGRPGGGTA